MTQTLPSSQSAAGSGKWAASAHNLSGKLWFLAAAAGQLMFIYYILVAYVPKTLIGQFERWDEVGLIKGYEAGDGFGNLMFITHVLLASVMTLAGLMQLTAPLRNWAPRLHRMSGRVFLVLAVYLALGGLWMVWGRGTRLNDIGAIASTLNTMLILVFAALTVHFAMKRDIARHRPWAMRLFMVANGVWFMRLFYGAWLMSVGPVGVSRQMNGWFDVCVSFGVMVIPLTGLEFYLRAQKSRSAALKWSSSIVTLTAAGFTALGGVGATLIMWGPHL
jgi:hypothetical protein